MAETARKPTNHHHGIWVPTVSVPNSGEEVTDGDGEDRQNPTAHNRQDRRSFRDLG